MFSAEELLDLKKRPHPIVYSLGKKEDDEIHAKFDAAQLNMKLKNMEELLAIERVKMLGMLSKAVWCPDIKKAKVTEKVGSFWDTLGHSAGSVTYLYPEETLYLIDIGCLELRYNNVLVSLQRAFFLLLHETGLTMDQYRVYSLLSILGYKVVRHSTKNILTKYEKDIEIHKIGVKHRDIKESCPKSQGKTSELEEKVSRVAGTSVLERLQIIQRFVEEENEIESTKVDFDVYLPTIVNSQFKKSVLQLPQFRIQVFSSNDPVPDFATISQNKRRFQDEVPLIYATVYPDFINCLQFSPVELPIINNKFEVL